MPSLDGQSGWQPVAIGRVHVVERGQIPTGQAAVRKRLKSDYPEPRHVASLVREHELLARAGAVPGVVNSLGLKRERGLPVLVMEDAGPHSLAHLLASHPLDTDACVDIAYHVCIALAGLHDCGLIHRDLNPANVVINAQGEPIIVDLGLATRLVGIAGEWVPDSSLAGTLAYLAPEQSGRTGLGIDPRADLYALGVTLFEMVEGSLPFAVESPREMLYAHLARPPSPMQRAPSDLERIVRRLLAKTPADRYPNATSVAADLGNLAGKGTHIPAPAVSWRSRRLLPPHRLIGRDRDTDAVRTAFADAVAEHRGGLILIEGAPGVGKSAFAHQMHGVALVAGLRFGSSRFVVRGNAAPYAPWTEAIEEVLLEAAEEHPEGQLMTQIRMHLGPLAQAAVGLVPSLGDRSEGAQLAASSPTAARARAVAALVELIRCVAEVVGPVALLLDDLDLATDDSLAIASQLVDRRGPSTVVLIGTLRPNHAMRHPILRFGEPSADRLHIELAPLSKDEIAVLCADRLALPVTQLSDLAHIVTVRSGGNPLSACQLLDQMVSTGAIRPTPEGWTWELDVTQSTDESTGLDLLPQLPRSALRTLAVAAVAGTRFDLALLAHLSAASLREAAQAVWPACEAGVLLPTGDSWRLSLVSDLEEAEIADLAPTFTFTHDRHVLAARELLPATERGELHIRAARWIVANTDNGAAAVEHLMAAEHDLGPDRLPADAGALALAMASEALATGAPDNALAYAQAALSWSPASFATALVASQAAFATNSPEELADEYALLAEGHAQTDGEVVLVATERVIHSTVRGDLAGALAAGLDTLVRVEPTLVPLLKSGDDVMMLDQTLAELRELGMAELAQLPAMTDQYEIRRMGLLSALIPASFFTDQPLFTRLVLVLVGSTLRSGVAPGSTYPITFFGFLVQEAGDGLTGRAIAQAGIEIARRRPEPAYLCRALFTFAHHISHWRAPLSDNPNLFDEAFDAGVAAGDMQWAGYAWAGRVMNLFPCCGNLDELLSEVEQAMPFLEETGNAPMIDMILPYRQAARWLRGDTDGSMSDADFSASDWLAAAESNSAIVTVFHAVRAQACYLAGQYEEAFASADQARRHQPFIRGLVLQAEVDFYGGLAAAQLGRRGWLRLALRRMGRAAEECPVNFEHKLRLLESAAARAAGRPGEALDAADLAARLARDAGYLQDAALANELAGRLMWAEDKRTPALAYLQAAHDTWALWGARIRTRALLDQFPALQGGRRAHSASSSDSDTGSRRISLGHLDLGDIERAGASIAEERDPEAMSAALLDIAVGLSGATGGALLEVEGDALRVVATHQNGDVKSCTATFAGALASATVVGNAQRSMAPVVVNDASEDPRLRRDPRLNKVPTRSILCVPSTVRGRLARLLYLENELAAHAFGSHRVRLLTLLTTWSSVAIENARLFERLRLESDRRLESERQLQRSQRLESVGRLASGVAHDFNNLLSVVLGWSDLIGAKAQPGSELSDALEFIQAACDRGAALTRQLLAFGKVSEANPEAVDLVSLVEGISKLMGRVLGDHVDLVVQRPPRPISPAWVDPALMEQVVMNLIVNARDALPGAGIITIGFDSRSAEGDLKPGRYSVVSVADDGVGMNPAVQERIFEPFFSTKGMGGTGLGLSTCIGIVEQSDGTIRVTSTPGEGATFTVFLPVASSQAGQPVEPVRVIQGAQTGRVLLVEDEAAVRDMLCAGLKHLGFTVDSCGSGEEAMALIEGGLRPDVLVSDWMMPGMSGLDLLRRARAALGPFPAILTSGVTQVIPDDEAFARFLPKPFPVTSLAAAIAEVVREASDSVRPDDA